MSEFLRPGSIRMYSSRSRGDHGTRWATEYYPFQGLDIPYEPTGNKPMWMLLHHTAASIVHNYAHPAVTLKPAGNAKWPGTSPFGTPLGEIARRELGMPAREGWGQAGDSWFDGDMPDPGPARENNHSSWGKN